MAQKQIDWEKVLKFEVDNGLTNNHSRLGQALRQILKKDTESILFAIKILESEINERTEIKK